jgi:hypothetical protein
VAVELGKRNGVRVGFSRSSPCEALFLYAVTLIKKIAKFAYFCIPRLVVKFGPRLQPDDFVVVEQRFGI